MSLNVIFTRFASRRARRLFNELSGRTDRLLEDIGIERFSLEETARRWSRAT